MRKQTKNIIMIKTMLMIMMTLIIISGLMRERDFWKRVFNEKEKHRKSMFLTGRQVAWMICEHVKISDTDGAVLDIADLLKIELKGENVQTFDTKWDETINAMQKRPDEEPLENLYFKQLEKSDPA